MSGWWLLYPVLGACAGILAGLLGIGGGLVLAADVAARAAFPGELAVAGVDGVALQREAASHDRTLAGLTDRVARAFAASL